MQITGTVRGTRSGFAFLARDDGGEDVFIPATGLGGAIHGDRVRATAAPRSGYDFRPEAQVEEILERPRPEFTGNVHRLGKNWFVRPDSPLLPERLRLVLGSASGVSGMKILFSVENRADRENTPEARFLQAIGDEEDARLDPVVIATEFGLSTRFSEEALAEALQSTTRAEAEEDEKREDFRGQYVLTIDPEDAKDFDDAVAIERVSRDEVSLTVHIADVSFYVPEAGALDSEAAGRGESVYFPGSVIPMLPEAISTVAASLGPEDDKRVLSVRMRFDADGKCRSTQVSRGWIRSRARLHYQQAQAILEGNEEAPAELVESLRDMAGLARRLRRRRFREGGFDLEVPEAEMTLGPDGVPVRIRRRRSLESHRLIEEFMIAANRAVGEWAHEHGAPFLYRVHEEPDVRSLARFEETVLTLLPGTAAADLAGIARIRRWLSTLPRTPVGLLIHRYFLRSLKKAVYSPDDLGHFGLGIRGYCHFTSPIRRYPDLFDHRRIKELIDGKKPVDRFEETRDLALGCTRAEINGEEAEREMVQLKSVRYMERRLGEEAAGHVSALTPQGLFIELDSIPVEGFVPRDSLPVAMHFMRERLSWAEDRSGWEIRPGDPVRVQVTRCDLRLRRIEFLLVESPRGPKTRGRGSRTRTRKETHARAGTSRKIRGRRGGGGKGHPARKGQGRRGKRREGS